ncbi:hypothetical protein V8G54_011109 [Vigna mungo]|uniref:Uncharacterized protein n=1 Tax=Vigna mungo TaxID=3915 RepID=A0AAQ3NQU4_VIGMU
MKSPCDDDLLVTMFEAQKGLKKHQKEGSHEAWAPYLKIERWKIDVHHLGALLGRLSIGLKVQALHEVRPLPGRLSIEFRWSDPYTCQSIPTVGHNNFAVVEVFEEEEEDSVGLRKLLGEEFVSNNWRGSMRLLLLDECFAGCDVEELPDTINVVPMLFL